METIIKNRLLKHIEDNNALSEKQHGFMKGKSCLTNLLETFEEITCDLDHGNAEDVMFLDYAKAFDSVPHLRLLNKLKAYGCEEKVLAWIKGFLIGRTQTVSVRNSSSAKADVVGGVPQGSVLGPLLFILYINDLPNHVKSSMQMFADDTKIFTTVNTTQDLSKLQEDLSALQKWSEKWLLRFNADKCKTMHFGSSNLNGVYKMNDINLQKIDMEKYLGVFITKDCKSSIQCTKAAQKAMNSLRVITRTFKYITIDSFTILYKTYIRPHLEYCARHGTRVWKRTSAYWKKYKKEPPNLCLKSSTWRTKTDYMRSTCTA